MNNEMQCLGKASFTELIATESPLQKFEYCERERNVLHSFLDFLSVDALRVDPSPNSINGGEFAGHLF